MYTPHRAPTETSPACLLAAFFFGARAWGCCDTADGMRIIAAESTRSWPTCFGSVFTPLPPPSPLPLLQPHGRPRFVSTACRPRPSRSVAVAGVCVFSWPLTVLEKKNVLGQASWRSRCNTNGRLEKLILSSCACFCSQRLHRHVASIARFLCFAGCCSCACKNTLRSALCRFMW